jgi:hypothetical protein
MLIIHLHPFWYREGASKGDIVFAKNVKKSVYVIRGNQSLS